ncbi:MAG: FkbM family methyltransferase [Cyanobium sp.]
MLTSFLRTPLLNQLRGVKHRLMPTPEQRRAHLLGWMAAYGIPAPQTLLHIGASTGTECAYYSSHGIEAWHVEAIPEVYAQLQAACSRQRQQHALQACVSNRPGEPIRFNIASNSFSSSMLGLGRHQEAHPTISYVRTVELTTTTVDELAARGLIPASVDFLVVDVQGAEKLVLEGAEQWLRSANLKGAQIETSVEPLYEGGSTYLEIGALLRCYDLFLCECSFNRNGWCDALFSRKYWP